jgi:O6-methylguanine-DNA--protein-cysteine methyltransferase
MALSKNPFAPIIPCHRVIRSDGKIGGYSATGEVKKKMKMLRYEKETGNAAK